MKVKFLSTLRNPYSRIPLGFASYMEYLGVDHVHKDWKMVMKLSCSDVCKGVVAGAP